jgi:hypothetical protein
MPGHQHWMLTLGWVALAVGCAPNRPAQDRVGVGLFDKVPVVAAPLESRCEKFKKGGSAGRACGDAEDQGRRWVHQLSSGDPLCLEGGVGDLPGRMCLARGFVADVATNRLLLDVRDAKPSSKWFGQESHQVWFEEGALVDLFLAERGF